MKKEQIEKNVALAKVAIAGGMTTIEAKKKYGISQWVWQKHGAAPRGKSKIRVTEVRLPEKNIFAFYGPREDLNRLLEVLR